ncbi:TM9SF4 [Bugula neritina]|uniref:Transmembrane 9 superfamily member n=1 Tax=Bugula neritina TaxID=10212 RepID=A0A7J7IXE3_BUGNE|nr:TM9SF4 [Bugula neritina]
MAIAYKEVLRGDRIVLTPYQFRVNRTDQCKILCKGQNLNVDQQKLLYKRIQQDYHVHLLTDNLPVATPYTSRSKKRQYENGYMLGMIISDKVYLHNHLEFTVRYHYYENVFRIVGFEVHPKSLANGELLDAPNTSPEPCAKEMTDENVVPLKNCRRPENSKSDQFEFYEIPKDPKGDIKVDFTYSLYWEKSDVKWASRWDIYLSMSNAQIHWFSILNSIVVIFFLAGVLAAIIVRTLKRDIANYNKLDEEMEEALEESGWKLVHGDVFRPPRYHMFLSALLGTGVQLFGLTSLLIGIAMLGMLSPANRGTLMTAGILVYVFMGLIAGFHAGRMYKTLKGLKWKRAALMTSCLYPLLICGCGFLMNFFIWGKKSSGAIPFTTMLAILALWFGISVPLVFLGFFFGYRKHPYDHPVRTNQIPRQVPEQPWYLSPIPAALIAGILPFGAMFIELFFIFSALWQNQFYYLFGFLFIVYVILVIACSQISIVLVYFQLCAEDYHWWWKSFVVSGGSALYLMGYSVFYFFNRLDIMGFTPTLLYFVYSFLMALSFWMLTGTIGFYAAYIFIRKIYGAIKID